MRYPLPSRYDNVWGYSIANAGAEFYKQLILQSILYNVKNLCGNKGNIPAYISNYFLYCLLKLYLFPAVHEINSELYLREREAV